MADSALEERLTVHFDANTSKILEKLNGLNRSVHGSAAKIEEDFAKIDIGKSLDKVFDSARLGVIEAGSERLRIFGSALEPLGPLGIGAGAGLAAFFGSLELAEKAGDAATEIQHLSEKLGLSAEQVQRYDYVWAQGGIGVDKGREALERLNEIFGQAQAGILRPQSLKAFQAIGFTQKQLESFGTVGEFIDALTTKLSSVGDAAERAGIAKRLGIESLVPLLHEGAGGIQDLTEKTRQFQVMSNTTVAKTAELNGELQASKLRIKEAADQFGTSMMPALVAFNGLIANSINLLNEFARSWSKQGDITASASSQIQAGNDQARVARSIRGGGAANAFALTMDARSFSAQGREAMAKERDRAAAAAWAQAGALLKQGIDAETKDHASPKEEGKPKLDIDAKVPKTKKTPGESFADLQASAAEGVDSAGTDYQKALAALTKNTQAHADLEIRMVADELAKQNDKTKAEIDKVNADKALTAAQKAQLVQELELAQLGHELTAQARTELIQKEAKAAQDKAAVEQSNAELQNQVDMLTAQKALAKTNEDRKALALQILALEEQIYEATQRAAIKAAQDSGDDAGARRMQTELSGHEATYGLRQQEVANQKKDETPGEQYVSQLQTATGSGIGDSIQTIGVDALKSFNSELTKAIVNGKNLGSALSDAMRQVESSLINLALEKYLTLPLAQAMGLAGGSGGLTSLFGGSSVVSTPVASYDGIIQAASSFSFGALIPHFAGGTDFAGGGPSLVGENGPEIVNLPKGASVTSNGDLGKVGVGAGMSVASPSISFDLRGAVMTADLVKQMQDLANGAETRATQNGAMLGLAAARTMVPSDMARRQSLQIR
jgi:hypothetical protein